MNTARDNRIGYSASATTKNVVPDVGVAVVDAANVDVDKSPSRESRLYQVIWRWHFYAGLIVLPVVLLASVTGALYVFKSEIEPLMYPQMFVAASSVDAANRASTVSLDTQIENAKRLVPANARLLSVRVSVDLSRATEIAYRVPDHRYEYHYAFVDPYTAAPRGVLRYGETFFDIVLRLHTDIYAGTAGRILVELATSWSVVLLVTGVYLWLPRKRERFWGVWLPRLGDKRKYVFWRDLHTVPAFYLALLTFLVLFSGLFLAYFFGQGYQALTYATGNYPAVLFDPPASIPRAEVAAVGYQQVVDTVRPHATGGDLLIDKPYNAENSFTVYVTERDSTHPTRTRQFIIEQYTGAILATTSFGDAPLMSKLSLLAYPVHVGSIYGLPTKILAFLVCLALVFLSITGAWMWWLRRPQNKTGFPRKPEKSVNKWLVIVIILLGVLMPTVGLSLVVIIAVDKTWRLFKGRGAAI
ncbi:MAG: PepSY domain-containing protein [Pyrinomonadaceae bacterium MAG19_C2-C3]|nr:PepSY domain-containing protein [Pyrinomonadaceae bacterium MAG19_C2-C3]